MAGVVMTMGEVVGSVPGVLGLAAALIGYGKMQARLREVEETLKAMNSLPGKLVGLETEMRSFGRRLDAQDRTLERMDAKLDRVIENQNNRHRGN